MTMKCPRCRDSELAPVRVKDLALDVCPRCEGIWFDTGELEQILKRRPEDMPPEFTKGPAAPTGGNPWEGDPCACPRCAEEMARYWFAGETGKTFLIDGCPKGHGVWLDGGELAQAFDSLKKLKDVAKEFAHSGKLDMVLDQFETRDLFDKLVEQVTGFIAALFNR